MFLVDTMLFGEEGIAALAALPTGGTSVIASLMISTPFAALVGFVAYRAQMKWYGDDRESAAIKGAIVAILIAIPTLIPSVVYGPSAVLGIVGRKKSVPKRGTKLWLWSVVALAIMVISVILWLMLGRRS
jgi:hypothetical protein